MEFQSTQNPMLAYAEVLLEGATHYTKKDDDAVYQAITQFKKLCKKEGYGQSDIDDACFFLCAFLDEHVSWEKSLLSIFYKSDVNKKNAFFDRLEQRQSDPYKNIDLLELAYVCLSLGFPRKGAISIMNILYSIIRDVREEPPHQFTVSRREKKIFQWRYPPIWVTAIIALVILISIFIPYNNKLNQYLTPALGTISNITKADNNATD